MYQVYKITNVINKKNYIGITTRGLQNRWKEHLSVANNQNSKDYNALFKKAIRKYGIENFTIELLENCDSIEEMKQKEIFYIAKYNSYAFAPNGWGYNSTLGGDGLWGYGVKPVVVINPLTCELEEYYNSITEAEDFYGRGVLECCKGYSKYHLRKIFLYYDDYKNKTIEEIQNIVDNKINIICQLDLKGNLIKEWDSTNELKKYGYSQGNISSCCLGIRNQADGYQWCYRKNLKEYLNKPVKINHTTARKVNQYDLDGNFIRTWNSISEAANELKIQSSKITCVCKGTRNKTGGFKWKYYEE